MEIRLNERDRTVFSPYGSKHRPFTDVDYRGQEVTIPPGTTLPDLARRLFGVRTVTPFTGRYSFLSRDDKERAYNPADDKFVFKNASSVQEFKDDAREILAYIVSLAKTMDLPTTKDKDRGVEVIDAEAIWEMLDASHPRHKYVADHSFEIGYLLSNQDIAKKFCVVRGVYPGWWTASYAGKNTPHAKEFKPALTAIDKAIKIIEKSAKFKEVERSTFNDLGDPLDTNVGFPLFSAEMSESGDPIARIKLLEMFKRLGNGGYNWLKVLKEINYRLRGTPLAGYPFAIAPIRRTQPGYKWGHNFNKTSAGLVTASDFRGYNTVRVAWMASYLLNLQLAPLQWRWKAIRKMLPGSFHDGDAKRARTLNMKANSYFVAEGDYSNYDRFIPVNLFLEFASNYLSNKKNKGYWMDLIGYLHQGIPIIWPDYSSVGASAGWIFIPELIGLLSGLKITAEEGTFMNLLVNMQSLMATGTLNPSSAVDYLTQYVSSTTGSAHEHFWIQSDDALLINSSLSGLYKQGNSFKHFATLANLSGSLMLGDRFLMRHSAKGKDTPVPTRVWQNTLSNEEPAEDPIKFCVGLAMRTDGMLGHKTYDAFGTGRIQPISVVELRLSSLIIKSLLKFLKSASRPVQSAISYLEAMDAAAVRMKLTIPDDAPLNGQVKMTTEDATRLDKFRREFVATLAQFELSLVSAQRLTKAQRLDSLVYSLHKEKNIPSSALLLQSILSLDPSLHSIIGNITEKEHTFFKYAMTKVNIPYDL